MAIVRFSEALRRSILNSANKTFDNKIDVLLKAIPLDKLYRGYLKEYETELRLVSRVPTKYLKEQYNSATLTLVDTILDDEFNIEKVEAITGNIHFTDTFIAPDNSGYSTTLIINLYDTASPMTAAILPEATAVYKEITAVDKKVATIHALITNHGSLNKALEAWGLLEQFVPVEYMNRIRAASTTSRAKKDKVNIDKDTLNSMTVDIMTKAMKDD